MGLFTSTGFWKKYSIFNTTVFTNCAYLLVFKINQKTFTMLLTVSDINLMNYTLSVVNQLHITSSFSKSFHYVTNSK